MAVEIIELAATGPPALEYKDETRELWTCKTSQRWINVLAQYCIEHCLLMLHTMFMNLHHAKQSEEI